MDMKRIIKSHLPPDFQVFIDAEPNELGELGGAVLSPDGKWGIGFDCKPEVLKERRLHTAGRMINKAFEKQGIS